MTIRDVTRGAWPDLSAVIRPVSVPTRKRTPARIARVSCAGVYARYARVCARVMRGGLL